MASDKNRILEYFTRKDLPLGILDFADLLSEAVKQVLCRDGMENEIYTQANINRFWSAIKELEEKDVKRGLRPLFLIKDAYSKRVSSFFDSNIYKISPLKFKLLKARSNILRIIDSINDRQFEALCCFACALFGSQNYILTPHGNEGGIDFLASIRFSDTAHYLFGINGPLRIVGQCKKYSSPVQVDEIRNFNSTLNDVYHLSEKVRGIIPGWFRSAKGPIIGWFIGHAGFQSGAEDRAKNFGIITSNSRDLAELIAGSKKFVPYLGSQERADHLLTELDMVLNNPNTNKTAKIS
jgi:hypothetical protein